MNERPILMVGATGLLGGEIVRLLREAGKPVQALVRAGTDSEKVGRLERDGVALRRGDLKDCESLLLACRGVETVVSCASSTLSRQEGDSIATVDLQGQLDLVDVAESSGVTRFVFVSFAPLQVDCALQRAKRSVEDRLRKSKMSFTVIQPVDLMEVWLSPALGFDPLKGQVRILGSGDRPVTWTSFRDVARFVVAATDNEAFARRVIPLGGPDALTPLQVVKIFEELGAPKSNLEFVAESDLEAQHAKASDPLQEAFAALMLSTARGYVANPREAIEVLPGRLRSVREYAVELMKQAQQGG